MNMAEYTSSWQSAAGAAEECQYLNQLYEDLKTIFLMGPSVKSISYVQDKIAKEKKWGKKWMEIMSNKGGSDA